MKGFRMFGVLIFAGMRASAATGPGSGGGAGQIDASGVMLRLQGTGQDSGRSDLAVNPMWVHHFDIGLQI